MRLAAPGGTPSRGGGGDVDVDLLGLLELELDEARAGGGRVCVAAIRPRRLLLLLVAVVLTLHHHARPAGAGHAHVDARLRQGGNHSGREAGRAAARPRRAAAAAAQQHGQRGAARVGGGAVGGTVAAFGAGGGGGQGGELFARGVRGESSVGGKVRFCQRRPQVARRVGRGGGHSLSQVRSRVTGDLLAAVAVENGEKAGRGGARGAAAAAAAARLGVQVEHDGVGVLLCVWVGWGREAVGEGWCFSRTRPKRADSHRKTPVRAGGATLPLLPSHHLRAPALHGGHAIRELGRLAVVNFLWDEWRGGGCAGRERHVFGFGQTSNADARPVFFCRHSRLGNSPPSCVRGRHRGWARAWGREGANHATRRWGRRFCVRAWEGTPSAERACDTPSNSPWW